MAGGVFSGAKLNGMTIRESANDGSDFTNPDADYRRLFLGEDGELHVKDSSGTVTGIGGAITEITDIPTAQTDDTLVLAPDGAGGVEFRAEAGGGGTGQGLVDFAFARYVGGTIALNNTSWTDVPGPGDLVVDASAGDVLEVCLSGHYGNAAVNAALDAASIVSASPVNYISGGGGSSDLGVSGWLGLNTGSNSAVGASVMYTVQAGDISGGTVTLRLRYRTTSAVEKSLNASTGSPLQWSVKNIGPAIA